MHAERWYGERGGDQTGRGSTQGGEGVWSGGDGSEKRRSEAEREVPVKDVAGRTAQGGDQAVGEKIRKNDSVMGAEA